MTTHAAGSMRDAMGQENIPYYYHIVPLQPLHIIVRRRYKLTTIRCNYLKASILYNIYNINEVTLIDSLPAFKNNINEERMSIYNTVSTLICCIALLSSREIFAFTASYRCDQSFIASSSRTSSQLFMSQSVDSILSRRELSKRAFVSLFTGATIATISSLPAQSNADDDIIWKTGRAPQIPGQKPKDKSDVRGTKKDPSFLRSISDCKSKCENSYGPDGLSRSASECLSTCQDICCTTYEQCTFNITPR